MNFDQMINLIAEEVLRRLKNQGKRALVVLTGGSIGFNESILQIKKLIDDNWQLKIVLSKSAERVLTPKLIKDSLDIDDIYLEDDIKDLNELFNGIGLLVLPTLTMNTAAKIALCISDTLATNIVSQGIMKGIKIVAVKDACDLENPIRLSIGYNNAPRQYIDRMKDYMRILQEYRIKLVDSQELFDCITDNRKAVTNKSNLSPNSIELYLDRKVITREDIIQASQGNKEIVIGKNAVITALGRDTARDMGLKITRKL